MKIEGTLEGTPERKHDMKTWLEIVAPDPAFYLAETDGGETTEEATPVPSREVGRRLPRAPSGEH